MLGGRLAKARARDGHVEFCGGSVDGVWRETRSEADTIEQFLWEFTAQHARKDQVARREGPYAPGLMSADCRHGARPRLLHHCRFCHLVSRVTTSRARYVADAHVAFTAA